MALNQHLLTSCLKRYFFLQLLPTHVIHLFAFPQKNNAIQIIILFNVPFSEPINCTTINGLLICSSEVWISHYTDLPYPTRPTLKVYRDMFRVNRRVTLGLIFFTVLIQKSDKQLKVLHGFLKICPHKFSRVIRLSV